MTNSILCDSGNEVWSNDNSVISISYSDIQGDFSGMGNIDMDPEFAMEGYWDPNGTVDNLNDDYWVEGDYHLRSAGWRWDGLGEELMSVPVDPMNIWGVNLRVNMGVYGGTAEASMGPWGWALLADLNNDGVVNLLDYSFQALGWLKDAGETPAIQQPGDLDRDGVVGLGDIWLLVNDWLKKVRL